MGLFDKFKGSNVDQAASQTGHNKDGTNEATHEATSETESDTLSLEARNEKEIELKPNHITKDAQMGQQKAEAIALV